MTCCKCGHDINEHGADDPLKRMTCDIDICDCVEYEPDDESDWRDQKP